MMAWCVWKGRLNNKKKHVANYYYARSASVFSDDCVFVHSRLILHACTFCSMHNFSECSSYSLLHSMQKKCAFRNIYLSPNLRLSINKVYFSPCLLVSLMLFSQLLQLFLCFFLFLNQTPAGLAIFIDAINELSQTAPHQFTPSTHWIVIFQLPGAGTACIDRYIIAHSPLTTKQMNFRRSILVNMDDTARLRSSIWISRWPQHSDGVWSILNSSKVESVNSNQLTKQNR